MRELSKEKEIYISKFNDITETIRTVFKTDIWFVEIFGKRWSFIAGDIKSLPITDFDTIQITEKYGIVIKKDTDKKTKEEIITFINDLLK